MEIPNKLKKDGFRFIKLNGKIPIEKDWQNTKNYSYKEFDHKFNYGVATGYGGLVVIDWDDKEFYEKLKDKFPETFTIQTGSGGIHNYFLTDDPQSFKILDENQVTLADIQGKGKQVVGAGSIHPEANKPYIVLKDIDIAILQKEKLDSIFEHTKKALKNSEHTVYDFSLKEFDRIKKYLKFKDNKVNCLWHNETEPSLTFYLDTGQYHCFGCGKHGKISEFLREYIKKFVDDKQEYLFDTFNQFTNYLEIANQFVKKQPIYYDNAKLWWIWNFKEYRWLLIDETDLMNSIDQYTLKPSVNSKTRNEILEALKRVGRLNKPKAAKKTWIQFKDVVYDIKTGEEFEATSEYFITNPIPYELDKNKFMDTPVMDRIFEEWVGKDYVQTLYEIIAYCLLPDYPLHRIFCFLGGGMNGKGKFFSLLRKFVGEYNVCSTELDSLLSSRFEVARLHKKLVCQMGETNFNVMKKTSILKKLTGGDLIGYEYKNKNPFDDINYAKIMISTNNLPVTTDKTYGFFRRWLIIDFPFKFNEKQDILQDIPEKEYNALALKSVHILKDLMDIREFHNEGSVEDRMERYEHKSNPLAKFWIDYVVEDVNNHIYKYEFKKKLDDWCVDNNFRILSDNTIAQLMKEKDVSSEQIQAEWFTKDGSKARPRAWVGVKWKEKK